MTSWVSWAAQVSKGSVVAAVFLGALVATCNSHSIATDHE